MSKDLIVPIHDVAVEIYDQLCFEFFLQNNNLNNLSEEEQNDIIDLWNKKKSSSKYLSE